MFPPAGIISPAVACETLLPRIKTTHASRAVRLLTCHRWRRTCYSDGINRILVHVEGASASDTLNILCLEDGDAENDVSIAKRLESVLITATWARRTNSSQPITLAAVSARDVRSAGILLRHMGRAVTENVPCATYELSHDAWRRAVGRFADEEVLDFATLATELSVPVGYAISTLVPSDAALCTSTWAYNSPGAEAAIRTCIENHPSACVRLVSAENGGPSPPVAWILSRYDGSLGVLYTLPEHRGRGLARAVVKLALIQQWRWRATLLEQLQQAEAMSHSDLEASKETLDVDPTVPVSLTLKLVAEFTPYVHIAAGNSASSSLFTSLQFVELPGGEAHATWLIGAQPAPRFVLRPLRSPIAAREWDDLTSLVNTSYKQDDAFFVNHERTAHDGSELRAMGTEGTFFVGYALQDRGFHDDSGSLHAENEPSGLGVDCGDPHPVPVSWRMNDHVELKPSWHEVDLTGVQESSIAKPRWETNELLVAVYLTIKPNAGAAGTPFTTKLASLSLLTIAPKLKRLGCAQRILDTALEIAASAGADSAEVHVVSVKPWLLRFYRRNGFDVVGEDPWPAAALGELLRPCFFHRCRRMLKA